MTITICRTEAPISAQAMAVSGATRFPSVRSPVPAREDATGPERLEDRARTVRADLPVQIRADGMGAENLVRVTVALSDRRDIADDRRVRDEVPQGRRTGLTTIITATSEEGRLRPIEALAAA